MSKRKRGKPQAVETPDTTVAANDTRRRSSPHPDSRLSRERGGGEAESGVREHDTTRRRSGIAAALVVFAVTLSILMMTDSFYGITYDEPIYQSKSVTALEWLGLFARDPIRASSADVIDRYWQATDMHPGFYKIVTAISGATLGRLLPYNAVWRAGTNLLSALAFAGLYVFVAGVWGRAAGLYAAGALLLMPRVFGHCHLAALDAPIMAMSLLTILACWRACIGHDAGLQTGRKARQWAGLAGVLWGLGLGTKLNAFFVPFIVFPWVFVYARRHLGKLALSFAVLGPLAFFVTWPWLWHDTWPHFMEYFNFHFRHWQIGVMYFGKVYNLAPWHYPLVMTAITVPPVTLLLAVVGGVVPWVGGRGKMVPAAMNEGNLPEVNEEPVVGRPDTPVGPDVSAPAYPSTDQRRGGQAPSCNDEGKGSRSGDRSYNGEGNGSRLAWMQRAALVLVVWALVLNFLPSCLPGSPKYGGVRLFLPVFPFIATLAAVGLRMVLDALIRRLGTWADDPANRRQLVGLGLFLALVGPLMAVSKFLPHHLSYYNVFIGGLPGATRAGMEPTYWGDTYRSASLWLAEHAEQGATIWVEPVGFESTVRIFELGPLRPDLVFSAGEEGFEQADYAVTQNKATEFTDITRRLVAGRQPVFAEGVDGVPLVYVFRLR